MGARWLRWAILAALSGFLLGVVRHSAFPAQAAKESGPHARAAELFLRARQLLNEGDASQARQKIEEGLQLDPKSAPGYTLLGLLDIQAKDYPHAETDFLKALAIEPRSAEAHNNLGNCYVAEGKLDLGEKEFRTTLRWEPANRGAHYNLGLVLLSKKQPREAIVHFLRVRPPDEGALFNLTQAYFAAGDRKKGLETAERLSAQAKDDVRPHFTLGVLLAGNKEYEAARRELEAADALEPGTFEILFNLGQVFLRLHEPAKAETILGRALKLRADSAEALYYLAQAEADQKKDLDALELLVKARKLAPQNTDIIFLLARISMNERFHEDAIPLLEEGVKLAPNRPDLHAALGECYFTDGKIDKALEEFQALIKVDPSARSYAFVGLGYRDLGRFDEAKKYLERGLKLDPLNTACLYNMGYIASRQGNYDEAEKWFEKALRINPNYDQALLELASVKMDEKKYAEAVPMLRRYIPLNPHPAPAYYKLATAERNLHQANAAERDLKIFQTLSKDTNTGPYPFQHLFDYLDARAGLPTPQQNRVDLEELKQEVKAHPDRPENYYLLAETCLDMGRMEEAKQAIAQLDQLSEGDFRTAVGLGVLLARHRVYPEAVKHFQAALKANPNSDDAWYDLADAYFRARDYADALAAIQHVSVLGARDTSYSFLLGDIYAHLGRTEEAVNLFRQVIQANPDRDQAYLVLALTHLRSGDAQQAGRILEEGLARAPDSGLLFWGMGVLRAEEGKTDQAEQSLKKSVDQLPEWPAGYSALGVLYYLTGQIAKAQQTLKQFAENGPPGALDVERIEQVLSAASADPRAAEMRDFSPAKRQQFLLIALTLADQTL